MSSNQTTRRTPSAAVGLRLQTTGGEFHGSLGATLREQGRLVRCTYETRVTATEARRDGFRLLDEIVAGEQVTIERKGTRIILRREIRSDGRSPPDYSGVLSVRDAEGAGTWGCDEAGLRPARKSVRRE